MQKIIDFEKLDRRISSMKDIKPGTLVHYNEMGRLMSEKGKGLSGNQKAVNAHIGGQFFFSPHPMALDAHIHHTKNHTSLLGFLSSLAEKEELPLTELLKRYSPRTGYFIDLYKAYQDLWKQSWLRDGAFEDFLDYQKKQRISSTGYLDYSSGQVESLALMKNYFQNLGIPAGDDQVVMGTGFKNLYHTLMNVFMTKDVALDENGRDIRVRSSGTILVPRGHYQSLVKAPSWHNSRLKVVEKLDAHHISRELENRGDIKAVYFSVVANPSGEVMPEAQIREIAETVLEYNKKNRGNPVFVIADQVYNGSILKDGVEIFSIASVSSGAEKLSRMFDYTITIVSPSKTLGYASARVGFAASGAWIPGDKSSIISRMDKVLDNEGCDGMEVSNEVGVVAAYSFSSKEWIDNNSSYIKSQLSRALKHVDAINNEIGYRFFELNDPDAGWYILSKFPRKNIPSLIEGSDDLMVYFMRYNHGKDNSGFISRPGAQFGYEAVNLDPYDYLILRSTLAMQPEDLDDFFRRFKDGVLKLAALKELEMICLDDVAFLKREPGGIEKFIREKEKTLLSTRKKLDLSAVLGSSIKDDEICSILKNASKNELSAILE
ncbi:MAG: pyridoxal phosphate-dependent aminotransferase [Spirochaetia bacterium]|jgi:aspartate/methionine/tyrosine aminotransferase|nr:pyridoxal phosphate-dependent aminotransferase [Spirochaetia bacterium]